MSEVWSRREKHYYFMIILCLNFFYGIIELILLFLLNLAEYRVECFILFRILENSFSFLQNLFASIQNRNITCIICIICITNLYICRCNNIQFHFKFGTENTFQVQLR